MKPPINITVHSYMCTDTPQQHCNSQSSDTERCARCWEVSGSNTCLNISLGALLNPFSKHTWRADPVIMHEVRVVGCLCQSRGQWISSITYYALKACIHPRRAARPLAFRIGMEHSAWLLWYTLVVIATCYSVLRSGWWGKYYNTHSYCPIAIMHIHTHMQVIRDMFY